MRRLLVLMMVASVMVAIPAGAALASTLTISDEASCQELAGPSTSASWDGSTRTCVISDTAVLPSIEVGDGDVLVIPEGVTLTLDGVDGPKISGEVINNGTINFAGRAAFSGDGQLMVFATGSLTNNGVLHGKAIANSGGVVTNYGDIVTTAFWVDSDGATSRNYGLIRNEGGSDFIPQAHVIAEGSVFTNYGTYIIGNDVSDSILVEIYSGGTFDNFGEYRELVELALAINWEFSPFNSGYDSGGGGIFMNRCGSTFTRVNYAAFADEVTFECDQDGPTASPTQSPVANAAGWNNSDVTVDWHWTDEAGGSGIAASCTTSSVSSSEGNPVTLTAACADIAGNEGRASYDVKVDKTAPSVTVTGVTDGGQYVFGGEPIPGCNSTDNLSGIETAATLSVTTPPGGIGAYTASCSGAADVAGNTASDETVTFTVVYGFGGFLSPLPLDKPVISGSTIPVKFRFTDAAGTTISADIAAALAAGGNVRVTIAGPPAFSQSVICDWDARRLFFQCNIKTPKGLLTGPGYAYTITAYEDVGTGFVAAPAVGAAVNPETVFLK